MKAELKQEFTRRITSANKSELIVIMYDMFHQDISEAIEYCLDGNMVDMKNQIRRTRAILSELINALDRQYEIANNLYSIYRFVERQIIESDVKRSVDGLREADRLMSMLGKSFREVAKQDTDKAIMENTESVYAGMTYGRNNLNENSMTLNRGILA